jgi:hypothetical protein
VATVQLAEQLAGDGVDDGDLVRRTPRGAQLHPSLAATTTTGSVHEDDEATGREDRTRCASVRVVGHRRPRCVGIVGTTFSTL